MFATFSKKNNRFLSDYVVGGCPRNISAKFRSKLFKIFMLGTFNVNLKIIPLVKKNFFWKSDFLSWVTILKVPSKVLRMKILRKNSEFFKKLLNFPEIFSGHPPTT